MLSTDIDNNLEIGVRENDKPDNFVHHCQTASKGVREQSLQIWLANLEN
jgi:hypothetical protein